MSHTSTNGGSTDLGSASLPGLILKYSIPSILAMLVTALYNITDQIFIGHIVGLLGNAATNIVFPLSSTLCVALAQLAAIGAAANFNISQGQKDTESAKHFIGNGLFFLIFLAVFVEAIVLIFRDPIIYLCGASDTVFPYARDYLQITGFGFSFFIFSTGAAILIRADGSPRYSMFCSVSGAILNIFLDYLFMVPIQLGIQGAALATVIGQIVSFAIALYYILRKFKSFPIRLSMLKPRLDYLFRISKLGLSNFLNLAIMMLTNIVMNNVLRNYGAASIYGSDIPLAVSGIVNKIQAILIAFVVGLAQGGQPILSYNMGARNYARVKKTYLLNASCATVFSIMAFLLFQIFPDQITSIFGSGDALYYEFSAQYLKTFMGCVFLFGVQPITVNYFTSIGYVTQGVILSLSRQGLFLIPLILILPALYGLSGVMYAGPIAEILAFSLSVTLMILNFRTLNRLEKENTLLS